MAYVFRRPGRQYLRKRKLAPIKGRAALSTRSAVESFARNAPAGKVPILAQSAARGKENLSSSSGNVPLRVAAYSKGTARATLNAALAMTARAAAMAQGRLALIGVVSLSLRSAGIAVAIPTIRYSAALKTLAATSTGGRVSAIVNLPLQFIGKSTRSAVTLLSSVIGLRVNGAISGTARAGSTLKAVLKTATVSASTGRAAFISRAVFAAYSKASSAASVAVRTAEAIAIFARSSGASAGLSIGSAVLAMRANASGASIGGNSIAGRVYVAVRSVASGAGRATSAMGVVLRASSIGLGTARVASSFVAGLQAVASSIGQGSASIIVWLALATKAGAHGTARATFSIIPVIFLVAVSAAHGMARVATAGVLGLQAAGKLAAMNAANFSGAINFTAIGRALARGRAGSTFKAGLRTIGAAVGWAQASPIGVLTLKALGALGVGAQAAIKASGLAFLSALSRASGAARVVVAGGVSLFGQSSAGLAGRVSALVRAAFNTVASAAGQAHGGQVVRLGLSGQGKASGTSRYTFSGRVGLQAVAMTRALGRAFGFKAVLKTVAGVIGQGRVAIGGRAFLTARGSAGAIRAALSAFSASFAAMVSSTQSRSFGRGTVLGRLALRGAGRASGIVRIAGLLRASLSSISLGRSKATVPVKGILTLTTASTVQTNKGSAHPTIQLQLTAISSFGRSVANAFGILVFKHAIFVDPAYVVNYPKPIRSVCYPKPVRIVSYSSHN